MPSPMPAELPRYPFSRLRELPVYHCPTGYDCPVTAVHTDATRQLPAGPDLGRVTQGVLFHRDPLGFLRRMRDRHGDVFTLRLAIAGPMVIVTVPAAAERIVDASPTQGHAGEARRRIVQMISPPSVLGA